MATELQLQLLNHIALSEYTQFNGARPDEPVGTYLFIDEIARDPNITINQAKGVVGSAVEADLVGVCEGPSQNETCIDMTQAGFDTWLIAYPDETDLIRFDTHDEFLLFVKEAGFESEARFEQTIGSSYDELKGKNFELINNRIFEEEK